MKRAASQSKKSASNRRATRSFRKRQASIARILNRFLGKSAKNDPRLWHDRTYLMLVGLVYDRLSTSELEIPTDNLVALAKILGDHRRSGPACPRDSAASAQGKKPKDFAEVVREVYGTNWQSSERTNP